MLSLLKSLDRVLKGDATGPAALQRGTIELPVFGLTFLLLLLAALYGACMGSFAVVTRWSGTTANSGWLQLAFSAAKVPMLFFLTLLITFPSLYVFNALVGCRLHFGAILRLLIAALAVTLSVLASFGTIVVFFSLCTTSYPFMVLLNALMFAIAALLGMSFLLKTLRRLAMFGPLSSDASAENQPIEGTSSTAAAPPRLTSMAWPSTRPVMTVFVIWVVLFLLIGAQMGWVLRPFIGSPTMPVTFFRVREGNFLQAIADRVADLADESSPRSRPPNPGPTTMPEGDSRR